VDWIGLAQDRNRWRALVNSVLNLRDPWNAGKLSSGQVSSGFSISVQLHSYFINLKLVGLVIFRFEMYTSGKMLVTIALVRTEQVTLMTS
jgi:hypothetical protein